MKAQMCDAVLSASSRAVLAAAAAGKVSKSPRSKDAVSEEMQVYFSKLKELVPFMPKNKRLSKLEIIQYVIDYICDLQLALETHPATLTARSSAGVVAGALAHAAGGSPTRQPLGVIAAPNTLPNTCAAQEANHLDKAPAHLDDLSTRPVSC